MSISAFGVEHGDVAKSMPPRLTQEAMTYFHKIGVESHKGVPISRLTRPGRTALRGDLEEARKQRLAHGTRESRAVPTQAVPERRNQTKAAYKATRSVERGTVRLKRSPDNTAHLDFRTPGRAHLQEHAEKYGTRTDKRRIF